MPAEPKIRAQTAIDLLAKWMPERTLMI